MNFIATDMRSTITQAPGLITTPTLATRFARSTRVLRSDTPLTEDEMHQVAPSICATGKHASRSDRYTHIATIEVLRGLRREGFAPYMVAQGRSRIEGRTEYTKHLVRLRHASQVQTRPEMGEIILINSHDGASTYQLMSGLLRLICLNGLVVGSASHDIRIAHRGQVEDQVIEGAIRVLQGFETVDATVDEMKSIELDSDEEQAFAHAALRLRYRGAGTGTGAEGQARTPVTADQYLEARRPEDLGHSLWVVTQRLQEHLIRGGQPGRCAGGRRVHTREIHAIDRSIHLNRALWNLADEIRRRKA
jgi:hypothetical protein